MHTEYYERERELLLGTSNMKYVEGVEKFGEKIQKLSQGQLATILHNFGTSSYFTKRRQGLPATTMRRVEKATISVQTESLKKVQCSFRNHKALPQGKSSCIIRQKVVTRKREHKLSTNIIKNDPAAKKHSKTMLSTTHNTVTVQSQKLDVIGEKRQF